MLINENSLGATVDAVNDAYMRGQRLRARERDETAHWIAARQHQPGAYRPGLFAPLPLDFEQGLELYTGERVESRAGIAHVLGEEACRALILLDSPLPEIVKSLERARASIQGILEDPNGWYCCRTCSVALWRHLAANSVEDSTPQLSAGVSRLRECRKDDGTWAGFPFYYTLLALTEMGDLAGAEIKHAADRCERLIARLRGVTPMNQRRHAVLSRALCLPSHERAWQ